MYLSRINILEVSELTRKNTRLIPKNKRFDFPELIVAAKRKKIKIGVFPIDDNSWADVGQWSEYKKSLNLLGYKDE